jgi:hypothetical protein
MKRVTMEKKRQSRGAGEVLGETERHEGYNDARADRDFL